MANQCQCCGKFIAAAKIPECDPCAADLLKRVQRGCKRIPKDYTTALVEWSNGGVAHYTCDAIPKEAEGITDPVRLFWFAQSIIDDLNGIRARFDCIPVLSIERMPDAAFRLVADYGGASGAAVQVVDSLAKLRFTAIEAIRSVLCSEASIDRRKEAA